LALGPQAGAQGAAQVLAFAAQAGAQLPPFVPHAGLQGAAQAAALGPQAGLQAAGAQQLGFLEAQQSGLQQGFVNFETTRWYEKVLPSQGLEIVGLQLRG
jgi:hypothetical protein